MDDTNSVDRILFDLDEYKPSESNDTKDLEEFFGRTNSAD